MGKKTVSAFVALFLLFAGLVPAAHAVLERVGPVNPDPKVGNFPAWYQDTTGLTLEFCAPLNQAEVDGGWCLLLPGDVSIPEIFPSNFFDEHFWFAADAGMTPATGGRALLVLAVEAAFAADVAPGGQIAFSRIRLRLDAPAAGTYRFIHPYGEEEFTVDSPQRIFITDDVGISCPPGQFDCALQSRLGPFLLPSNTPGGAELPAVTGPVPGKLYIADPARSGPVTGSTLGSFFDGNGVETFHNIFRIEGPTGSNLGGPGVDFIETTDFTLMGRVFQGSIAGLVTVDRASYARPTPTGGNKLDVFATGFPTTQGRLPANPSPAKVAPVLAYYGAPCIPTLDQNGNPGPPYSEPVGVPAVQMFNQGNAFWGQSQPPIVPPEVCVEDYTARDATGQVVPAFFPKIVTDQVTITQANYDPNNGGSLTVQAASSDEIVLPGLTLGGFGNLLNGQIVVAPLAAPPSKVRVLSDYQGVNEFQVTTAVGSFGGGGVPVAGNDDITIGEDSGTTNIPVLANDTFNGSLIVYDPGTVIVTITGAPRLGIAAVNNGAIDYTPNLNANGTEGIAYTVTVDGATSPAAYVTIIITPVNDAPVANDDSTSAVVGVQQTINVLANDTDVDGQADLAGAANVTPSAGLTIDSVTGGNVTFTAAVAGTYTFTYNAQDQAGALSATPATVTVNVSAGETISVTRARFTASKLRWQIDGTDSVRAGQTLTITLANGTAAGSVIGTTVVDVAGAWALDILNGLDPRPSGATQIRVRSTSPALGGDTTFPFQVK